MSELKVPITGHEWGRANHMILFNGQNSEKIKKTALKSRVTEIKWLMTFYDNRVSRSLVSESASLFKSIQRVSMDSEPLTPQELIKLSRKYRSVIHEAYVNLRSDGTDSAVEMSNMYYQIEILWNLCEILYMDIHHTGFLVTQLLMWIRWHFTNVVSKAQLVINEEMPHIHESYWDVIIAYLSRGEIDNARRFIELHPDSDIKEEFIMLRDLLKKMPLNSPNQLLHEFCLRWQSWHEECQRLLNDGHFELNPKIKLIVRLISGDHSVFGEITRYFDSWYQLMVSFLLFTDPCLKEFNLSALSVHTIDLYFGNDKSRMTTYDKVLTAAFSYDLMQVIEESLECFNDNWWFVTHFIDLIYNSNQMNDHHIDSPEQFREFFVIDYANSLMTHDSLWHFGIDYLDYCNENGLNHIELNLQRIPLTNDYIVEKVLNISHNKGFVLLYKSICKINSRKWLNKNRIGSALYWAIRSEDSDLTTHIANLFLDYYYKNGEFLDEDILNNLGQSMIVSDRLTFLVKYYEFHQFMKESKLKEASELLVSLLSSNVAPKFFIVTLLMDSIPLLETQNLVMNADHSRQVLASLEDMLSFQQKESIPSISALKDREDILRLAISRNLARAYIL